MRRIDEPHTALPCCGTRRMVAALRLEGVRTGCNRVGRLMRMMGIAAMVPKTATRYKGLEQEHETGQPAGPGRADCRHLAAGKPDAGCATSRTHSCRKKLMCP